jgi:mannose-6-phosphate isomerase-like protein (cupin superfamily)
MLSKGIAPGRERVATKVIQASESKFNPHAQFKGVEVCNLLTKREDHVDVTCTIVRWHVGAEIAKHVHEHSDDILYFIQGKAKIWIEGVGDVPVSAGSFVRIPKGVQHQPHSITEEVVAHDMWFPALF